MNDSHLENMSLEIDRDKRRMLFTQSGPLDKSNVVQSFHLVHDADGFDPSYDTVVDFLGITEVNLGYDDLIEILDVTKEIEKRTGRGALVVGQDTGRIIFAKLFCQVSAKFSSAKIRYKAFQTTEEAKIWLDSDD